MTSARLVLNGPADDAVSVDKLVIAGWTARDRSALDKHIEELRALGVAPPSSVPAFFPVEPALLTTAREIAVAGPDTSGEVEFVLFSLPDGLWVGLGSDHTDRRMEAKSVADSKRACAKPVAPDLWRYSEIADHWDALVLRSFAVEDRGRRPHQEGAAAAILPPRDLIRRYRGGEGDLPLATAMFCGTLPALGPLVGMRGFEMELADPVLGRTIRHAYRVRGPEERG